MNECYFCGELATSKEHVPPKSLFPEGMRNHLIKVPSCEKNNNSKSGDDEYFRYMIMSQSSLPLTNKVFKPLINKFLRSIKRKPALTQAIMKTQKDISYDGGIVSNTFKLDDDRINQSLVCIARGLFFHEIGKVFSGSHEVIKLFSFYADENSNDAKFIDEKKSIEEDTKDIFSSVEYKGGTPLVFKYKALKYADTVEYFLTFYNDINASVLLKKS